MHSARIILLGTLAALAASAQIPRLFYTDLDSGPNTGGERNQGAYVTIYGKRFGEERGNSTVTVGSGAVASYVSWSDTKVVVQLGAFATSGEIRMQTSGGQSNGLSFTVRPGSIFFVSRDGRDIAPNDGSFATPWRTVQKAVDTMAAGDVVYVMDGIAETRPSSSEGSVYISGTAGNGNNGAVGMPKALVAYPGARPRIGAISSGTCSTRECVEGIRTGWASSHWTIAGFQLFGNNYGIVIRGRNWRVIGNEFTCPFGSGASACVDASQAEQIKLWGNNVHDTGYSRSSALYHGVYFSTDSNDLDIGWNTISRVQGCRGIQINSTPNAERTTGFNQYNLRIHDNLIEDTQCDGIVLSTVDPSKGAIEIFNNIIVNAGRGPATPEGGGNFACLYVAGATNNGSPGGGTIEVFHNTMVDCGGFNASSSNSGGVMLVERNPALSLRLRNNIVYQRRSPYFGVFDATGRACNTTCRNLAGTNNMFFGLGSAPPANPALASLLVQDPLFASLDNRDFRLRATSPARGAGISTGLVTDRDGVIRTNQVDIGAYQSSGSSLTGPPPLVVTPDKIDTSTTAGSGAPPPQRLTLTNNGTVGVEWAASSNQPWLVLGTRQGVVPGGSSQVLTVSFLVDSLPPGPATATITILAGEGRITIPVQITIATLSTTGPALWTSSSSVTFTANTGTDPVDQTVRIANFGAPGSTMRWTARTDQSWLRVSPSEGSLIQGPVVPLTLSAVAPGRLGLFTANLILTADGATGSPLTIPVRLAIGSPKIGAIVNAASLQQGPLSVRTIITIFGQDIGPDVGEGFRLTPDNRAIASTGGDVQVFFGDTPAPILYASNSQVNAVVPVAAGLSREAQVRVEYLTRRSDPITVPIAITSPAIFSLNGTGSGPGAILNQDGNLNTDESPAAPGSVIAMYLTGLGNISPTALDAEIINGTGYSIGNATQVAIGGRDVGDGLRYIGVAPGFIAGVFQINVVIPAGLPSGRHAIRITSGGISSPATVTVAVQ